jgi:hypothetical protein
MIGGDKDTGDNSFPGINDTGEQLSPVTTTLVIYLSPVSTIPGEQKSARDINSGEQFIAGVAGSLVSLIPVISCSPMLSTQAIRFFIGVVDTGHK